MMIEKEAGDYIHAQFPAMWKGYISPSGQIRYVLSVLWGYGPRLLAYSWTVGPRYKNILTGIFELTRPPPLAGGILADVIWSPKS